MPRLVIIRKVILFCLGMGLLNALVVATVIRFETVFPRQCIEFIELSEHSECRGPDHAHIECTNLRLHVKNGCEKVNVVRQ